MDVLEFESRLEEAISMKLYFPTVLVVAGIVDVYVGRGIMEIRAMSASAGIIAIE